MGMTADLDDQLLPISALQHLLYCPRQCALIHLEQLWTENVLTIEGRILHEKADHGRGETRPGVRIARGLMIRSAVHRLIGKADVVEYYTDGRIVPVEYKRGRPKTHDADCVQLCAQGLCLEEMHNCTIPAGAIFYGQTRRRLEVPFDTELRGIVLDAIARLQALLDSGLSPTPVYTSAKCDRCSLVDLCLPKTSVSVEGYLGRQILPSALHTVDDPFAEDDAEGEAQR